MITKISGITEKIHEQNLCDTLPSLISIDGLSFINGDGREREVVVRG